MRARLASVMKQGVKAGLLEQFLGRPHIYSTKPFRERYEASARENLRRSLQALG